MSRKYGNPYYEVDNFDLLKTLVSCGAYYKCPEDEDGNYCGPLVGYAGEYEEEDGTRKHYVGAEYFNFSQADQWPEVLEAFGIHVLEPLEDIVDLETVILGAPMAGIKFSYEVAKMLGCRHFFAEKILVSAGVHNERASTQLALSRYQLHKGQKVVIGEELVNNCSTTKELMNIVEIAGGEVVAIVCAINRSYPFRDTFEAVPIISALERPTLQFMQHDPRVAKHVSEGNVIWKPKHEDWPRLLKIMRDTSRSIKSE